MILPDSAGATFCAGRNSAAQFVWIPQDLRQWTHYLPGIHDHNCRIALSGG